MREYVLITGSSNGIGEAMAKIFAEHDYNLIIHGRNETDLERVREQIQNKGVECHVVRGDLRNEETLDNLYSEAKERDISILVNNAGARCPTATLDELSYECLEDVLRVNLHVPIKLTKMVYPIFLKKSYGAIMNMNSIIGQEVKIGKAVFSGSRWGLRGFTESLRLEAKNNGIRVIGIYPTRVKTKPEFEYGMEPLETARRIYEAYKNNTDDIILDGRPEEYRPKK